MSGKFDAFKAELEALCRKHRVQLAAEGYDALQVWDAADGDEPIHATGLEDCTDRVPTSPT